MISQLIDRGWLPDRLIRFGIRRIVAIRLRDEAARYADEGTFERYVDALAQGPVAVESDLANRQHYEVPAWFFERVLGPQLKYSACVWNDSADTLADAEEAALAQFVERAQIADGDSILELGCGWGSLTLYLARRFPNSPITAVSNSESQCAFIEARATARALSNVTLVKANAQHFDPAATFDRVVSIEMLEHMRNYAVLFERIASWLRPDGRALIHVFTHRCFAYLFEDEGPSDWMARNFFTGGQMPSRSLFEAFDEHLRVELAWHADGTHYAKTLSTWLANLDIHRAEIQARFTEGLGAREARATINRWRVFFMACQEMFAFNDGRDWGVSHFRMVPAIDRA